MGVSIKLILITASNGLRELENKSGGVIGITRTNTSLVRWTLSYNIRTSLSMQTYRMIYTVDTGHIPIKQQHLV